MEILIKHRDAAIPDVRQYNREVTDFAAQLLMRLMQKFPESRPASGEEVLKSLDSPGMILDVDSSGSPFKILPPPVEASVGLAAEMESVRPGSSEQQRVAVKARSPDLPDPPPAVEFTPGKASRATWAILASFFLIFCGPSWSVLVHADWAAAGVAAIGCAAVLALAGARAWLSRLAGPILFAAACYCFVRFGARPDEAFPPPIPGFEVVVVAGLGVILGGAGLFLGFIERQPDRQLAASLLAGAGAVLLVAGVAHGLPDSASWQEAVPASIVAAWRGLKLSGGLIRWTGLAAAYAAARFIKAAEFDELLWSRRKTGEGVIINWNK